jgi:hypothetical protein
MQIESQRTGTLLERLPEQIRAPHDQRQRLKKAFTAPSFLARMS